MGSKACWASNEEKEEQLVYFLIDNKQIGKHSSWETQISRIK